MKIHVAYFGPACDWAGVREEAFDVPSGIALRDAASVIVERRVGLASRRAVLRFAVNETFVGDDCVLCDGDRVAVIPPVSGGCDGDMIAIVEGPIDGGSVRRHVGGDAAAGGVVVFEGVTRFERNPEGKGLLRLEYEAYGEMAVKQMRALAAEARGRWGVRRLAMVHRVGAVGIGETSVMIAAACGHRGEGFEACLFLIDELKMEVPIWKKEVWEEGVGTWVDPTKCG